MSDDTRKAALEALGCAVRATDFSNPLRCGECLGRGVGCDGEMDDDGWVEKRCNSCQGTGESCFAVVIRQALESPCPVPEGWKLVPVEPTLDMQRQIGPTLDDEYNGGKESNEIVVGTAVYKAMLAAAPNPGDDDG
jgi:hypothetical protein